MDPPSQFPQGSTVISSSSTRPLPPHHHHHQEQQQKQEEQQGSENKRPPRPQREQPLNCPRCNSTNTKFCYYNNYSLSQPRHFCKSCKRYWTQGGSLRNVPIGGGSRKNKRAPPSSLLQYPSPSKRTNLNPTTPSTTTMQNPNPNPSPIYYDNGHGLLNLNGGMFHASPFSPFMAVSMQGGIGGFDGNMQEGVGDCYGYWNHGVMDGGGCDGGS